jgi:elongation factor G
MFIFICTLLILFLEGPAMKQYSLKDIRNIAVVGHGGVGKTSIAEAMLFLSGVNDRLGITGDTSSIMDYDLDELDRGHSLSASIAFYDWNGKKINLIDTPGDSNFVADTPACLRVSDGIVLVISAIEGVQFYTEKVWDWATELSIPKIIFINKIDNEQADIQGTLDSIKRKFKVSPFCVQTNVGIGEKLTGVVDVLAKKRYSYQKDGSGINKCDVIPDAMIEEVNLSFAELTELVADLDDELTENYLENGELSEKEFELGFKKGIKESKLLPVFLGSATQNIGVDLLMSGIIDYLPSPAQRPMVIGKNPKDGSEKICNADLKSSLAAFVFKTVADPYAGKLTLFRVFSGILKSDSSIYNVTQETSERVGQVYLLQGKKQVPVSEVCAGDIGTVSKMKVTTTSDSLSSENNLIEFETICFPKPVLTKALLPKTRADEEKINNALKRLCEEDPTLIVERNVESHELLVSAMGQVHLDVTLDRMKRRFGIAVDVNTPKVLYRETIRGTIKVQGRHKKQSGGRGQFGDIWIEISPLKKGGGFVFEDNIVGGAIPRTYIPAVEKGVREAMEQGVIAGYPMVDIKIRLYDGSYHNVDSSEIAFKIAGSVGFKKGVLDCRPVLLEPIMIVEVAIPSEFVGDIMGDLNSKRGKVLGIDAEDNHQNIRAEVPMSEVLNYSADLNSMTSGKGIFTMEFDHYEDVPEHLKVNIIKGNQNDLNKISKDVG